MFSYCVESNKVCLTAGLVSYKVNEFKYNNCKKAIEGITKTSIRHFIQKRLENFLMLWLHFCC